MNNPNPLYGALGGDFIGSIYEFHNIKTKEFPLIDARCKLTDDSILTMATADAICSKMDYAVCYHRWGNRHTHRGYGGSFRKWLATPEKDLAPYGSWGNGSAMRVSPVGFAFQTVDDVLDAAEASASATHNHEEGIRGASATALAVFLSKQGQGKDAIKVKSNFASATICPSVWIPSGRPIILMFHARGRFPSRFGHFWNRGATRTPFGTRSASAATATRLPPLRAASRLRTTRRCRINWCRPSKPL